MKLEAKSLGNSWQICPCPRLHDIGRLWFFGKRRLSPNSQFPMQNAPRECGGLLLTQKTEVLIIIPSIMAPCCQVLNYFPVFHEGRGLSWILRGVNAYKNQLVQASMLVICLGFETGSRQREGSAPLSAIPTLMLYLLSRTGLANRVPKSIYS